MQRRIIAGIQARRVLSILYDGRWRNFEPYLFRRLSSGRDVVFGWQVDETFAGWHILYPPRIERFTVTRLSFEVRWAAFKATRPFCLFAVYAEVEASNELGARNHPVMS